MRTGVESRIELAVDRIGKRKSAAHATSVSVDSLRRYINGDISPDLDFLYKLAEASGVSVAWMVAGDSAHAEAPQHVPEDAVQRIADIEAMLEEAESGPLGVEKGEDGPNGRALADLRRIAADESLPRGTRRRAALAGEIGFGDAELAREAEQLAQAAAASTASRFRQVAQDLASATDEVGYKPAPVVEEALKTAMYSHGLTRDGAVTLLSALQAQRENTSSSS